MHQRIKEEKMNIEIVDRLNQIEIQEQVKWIFFFSRNFDKFKVQTQNCKKTNVMEFHIDEYSLMVILYKPKEPFCPQETARRQAELTSRVRAPAEAEKYRMQVIWGGFCWNQNALLQFFKKWTRNICLFLDPGRSRSQENSSRGGGCGRCSGAEGAFSCGMRETFDLNSLLEFDLIVMVSGCWTVDQVEM